MPPVREASTKPERGDGLAGARCVLEPEAARRRWDPRAARRAATSSSSSSIVLPVAGLLVLGRRDRQARPRPRRRRVVVVRSPNRRRGHRRVAVGVLRLERPRLHGSCGLGRRGGAIRSRSHCAAPRRAARSACPRARRPGGRTGPCRRRGAAPPRTAVARARAAARTCGATRSTAAWRPRRSRRAQHRAPGVARSRGKSVLERSRPRRRSARE